MNHRRMRRVRLLLLPWVFAGLAACHGDSGEAQKPKPAAAAKTQAAPAPGPPAAELTAGMVAAAPGGKSPLPGVLKFELTQRPTVCQPLTVGIAVLPQIFAEQATVQASGDAGLAVAADAPVQIPSVEPAHVYRQSLTVTPTREGVQFLTVNVSLKHDELTETRVFMVPLIAAAPNST